MNRTAIRRPFWLVVLLFAAQAHAQSASPTFPNPGKTFMSKENQHALGMEVAAQVYQQMPVLPDNSPESQYVRQLGQKLVATIPQQYSFSCHSAKRDQCLRPARRANVYQSWHHYRRQK